MVAAIIPTVVDSAMEQHRVDYHCLDVSAWRDHMGLGIWFQHGDNREHRRLVSSWVRESRRDEGVAEITAWLREAHEREATVLG